MARSKDMMTSGNNVAIPGISLTHKQRTRIKSLIDSNRLQEAQEIILGILDEHRDRYERYESDLILRVGDKD